MTAYLGGTANRRPSLKTLPCGFIRMLSQEALN